LVVDDCSPDASIDIVIRLMSKDERIKLLRHERNKGLGGARNTGIEAAKGEWLSFIDSDDFISPEMIQALADASGNGDYDIINCGFDRVDEQGAFLSEHWTNVGEIDLRSPATNIFEVTNPGVCNKLIKRSLFTQNAIQFPEHMYYEDLATTPKLFAKGRKLKLIGGHYHKYLIRTDSITNESSDRHLLDHFRAFDEVKSFLHREGLLEKHRANFDQRVLNSVKFHAGNVARNSGDADSARIRQYLKLLLLLTRAYRKDDDELRSVAKEELLGALRSSSLSLSGQQIP